METHDETDAGGPAAPPEQILTLARSAVDYVRRAIGVEMSLEPEALAFLDHYVKSVPADRPELVELLAPPLGAFFGEIASRALGGRWADLAGDPRALRIELPGCFLTFQPVGIAADVLARGRELEPGYDPHVIVSPLDEDLLSQQLEETPVEDDYYYSFTGRFETLERMADFLVARRLDPERAATENEPPAPTPIPPAAYVAELARRRS